jgi:hypothetical protein
VRDAIIADLADEQSVKGYLNPQPMPPAERAFARITWAQQNMVWSHWASLDRVNLRSLAYIR